MEATIIVFDDGTVVLEWWTELGAELARELGSDPAGVLENQWCEGFANLCETPDNGPPRHPSVFRPHGVPAYSGAGQRCGP